MSTREKSLRESKSINVPPGCEFSQKYFKELSEVTENFPNNVNK